MSFFLNDEASMPGSVLIEIITSFTWPKTSSIFPICVMFSK